MVRIRLLLIFFTALCAVRPVYADDAVSVRASTKDDYTRIVFEWPKPPSYVTDKTASSLTLKFQGAAAFKIDGAAPNTLPRVTSFATPDNKTATIGFISGQDVRHFEIGNRVIVDIRGSANAPTVKPEEAKPPEKTAEIKPSAAAKSEIIQPGQKPVPVAKVEPAPVSEAKNDQALKVQSLTPTVIQITSTENVGMAAFQRGGNLWVVLDIPDYPLQPQITGGDAKKFGSFERVPLKEATAFRLALPDDRKFHAEGGGLIWKIVSGAAAVSPTGFKQSTDPKSQQTSLLWPVPDARRVIDLNDPIIGDVLKIVPVESAKQFSGPARDYAEFGALPSFAGLAIERKTDDLKVQKTPEGILINGQDGLAVSSPGDIAAPLPTITPKTAEAIKPADAAAQAAGDAVVPKSAETPTGSNIFKFDQWRMGNATAADENKRILMNGLASKTDQGKAADLLTLAKMELAHAHGAEALGYLDLAQQLIPDLAGTPEFLALHGAADALAGQSEKALTQFSSDNLKNVPEIAVWRAYALASLEDWPQAAETMPKDLSVLSTYPDDVKVPVALALSEAALRDGDIEHAEELMKVTSGVKNLILPYQSALDYMKGEAARQKKNVDDAEKLWTGLKDGRDDLYRAKAGLALTALQLDLKKIKPAEAIDRLEGLRYAWRGDDLETSINYKLGQLYIANGEPIKGLILLRQAAQLSPTEDLRKKINDEMSATFNGLFQPNRIKDINPVDAITLYTEFSNLIPNETAKTQIERQLSDRLVDADLLPRAADLLQKQIDGGKLSGVDGATTSLRVASIYLQDGKPDKALTALAKANAFLSVTPADQNTALRKQIVIQQAEALSAQKKPEEAFVLLARLDQTQDVLRARADIAWTNKRWQDAADALEELSTQMGVSPGRPVNEEGASVLLNWSVALYLADNRYVLANLREKYSAVMATSSKASQFEVVTRPRQSALLSDRETINSIIEESDIFKGFVASSRASNEASSKAGDAKVVAPPKEAVPPQN